VLGIEGKSVASGAGGRGAWSKGEGWGRDERLGFVELFAGHEFGEGFKAIYVGVVAGSEGAGVPGVGRDIVERQALAMFIKIGEEGFGARMALLGGEAGPVGGLFIVVRDSDALEITIGETVLGLCETLYRGSAEPICGLDVVDWSGVAKIVERAQVLLRHAIAMLGGQLIPVK